MNCLEESLEWLRQSCDDEVLMVFLVLGAFHFPLSVLSKLQDRIFSASR